MKALRRMDKKSPVIAANEDSSLKVVKPYSGMTTKWRCSVS